MVFASEELYLRWEERLGGIVAFEGDLDPLREMFFRSGARVWTLDSDFEQAGPWGGAEAIFLSLLEEIRRQRPDLIERHGYELVYLIPSLEPEISVSNLPLTDRATAKERVRNYPADRAFRIAHGLIDLLDEWKSEGSPWVIVCRGYDRMGHMGRCFFDELVRRRGRRLRLLVLAISSSLSTDRHDPASRAESLEARVRDVPSELRLRLSDLIRLWHQAGRPEKALRWEAQALQSYNVLGMYEDARVYGERALAAQKLHATEDHDLHGRIFAKLFMTYLALQMPEEARRLADVESAGREHSPEWRAQFLYSMAMLYARYLPERDFARAEALLEQGLEELVRADIPEEDRHFQTVFNRNGLAMIRHFQGRFQEAIDLCRTGYEQLDRHLGPDQHKLHRSVLLYNIAQVHGAARADEEAIRYYSAAIEMDPGYSEYYNERGSIHLRRGEWEAALQDYRKAIVLSPPYYEVFANLGQCCRLLGRMEEAVNAYSRSLDLKPGQVVSLMGRAEAHEALDHLPEALADYEEALRLKPDHWPALASRAVLHHASGRFSQSLADLDRAIELAPQRPDLYRNRAVALADLHRTLEAVEDLRKYLRLCPDAEDRSEVEHDCRQLERLSATA